MIDVVDYTRLVEALAGDNRTDPAYVSRCDINGNGMVEVLDLGALLNTLSTRYGEIY